MNPLGLEYMPIAELGVSVEPMLRPRALGQSSELGQPRSTLLVIHGFPPEELSCNHMQAGAFGLRAARRALEDMRELANPSDAG